jgi:hypothetical protein
MHVHSSRLFVDAVDAGCADEDDEGMSAPRIDAESAAIAERVTGVFVSELGYAPSAGDVDYVKDGIVHVLSGLRARRAWTAHIGDILTATQTRELAGWTTRQALHKAVGESRVLRLTGSNGEYGYAAATFTDQRPAKPILGIPGVLRAWSGADPRGWATASWLTTAQPELGGRTPRQALIDGDDVPSVVRAAQQAADAYAA